MYLYLDLRQLILTSYQSYENKPSKFLKVSLVASFTLTALFSSDPDDLALKLAFTSILVGDLAFYISFPVGLVTFLVAQSILLVRHLYFIQCFSFLTMSISLAYGFQLNHFLLSRLKQFPLPLQRVITLYIAVLSLALYAALNMLLFFQSSHSSFSSYDPIYSSFGSILFLLCDSLIGLRLVHTGVLKQIIGICAWIFYIPGLYLILKSSPTKDQFNQ